MVSLYHQAPSSIPEYLTTQAVQRLEQGDPPKAVTKYASSQWMPPVSYQVSVGFSPYFNLHAFLIPAIMTSVDLYLRHRSDDPTPPSCKMCCASKEGQRSTPKGFLLPRIWLWHPRQGAFSCKSKSRCPTEHSRHCKVM